MSENQEKIEGNHQKTEGTDQNLGENQREEASINIGYAISQLLKNEKNQNPKAQMWESVIKNFMDGNLQVGSREPIKGTPAWVTLEVANGGFATGNYAAGGKLMEHEVELLKELGYGKEDPTFSNINPRRTLNEFFLTQKGLNVLNSFLESLSFKIQVPEESALLTVCWLLLQDRKSEAEALLKEIEPWFNQLRFYPIPSDVPLGSGALVMVSNVSEVVENLKQITMTAYGFLLQKSLRVSLPLYDRLLSLVLATSEGNNVPHTVLNGEQKKKTEGDKPFTKDPNDPALMTEYNQVKELLEKSDMLSGRRSTKGFGVIWRATKLFFLGKKDDHSTNRVYNLLAQINVKRGLPGSEKLATLRKTQEKAASKAGDSENHAKVLIKRLEQYPQSDGIEDIDALLMPITRLEAKERPPLEEGQPIIESIKSKVERAKKATVEQLCADGIIPSSEVLAVLIPSVFSSVRTSGLTDAKLAALLSSSYIAFKKRRSLLLLNLEQQVKFEGLPWCSILSKAANAMNKNGLDASQAVLQTISDVVVATLTTWPDKILPNTFIGAIDDILRPSKTDFPLTKELASDIFMHSFSQTFVNATKKSFELLQGTLYQRYFGLTSVNEKVAKASFSEKELYDLCIQLSKANPGGWNTANNGKIIEACMILSTHNLAVMYSHPVIRKKLEGVVQTLPSKIFWRICKDVSLLSGMPWKAQLQTVKDASYAWRQMIFFASLLPNGGDVAFFEFCDSHLKKQNEEVNRKLGGHLNRLKKAWKDESHPWPGSTLVGWTTEKHSLMK
eukprot:TRINITY_DN7513_c0_g1_i1.p1 TRINITY_DN7513_c0_g1~~TRINITY_DN7513_c0_g1_i1.p1  ORF type:complete len:824 (+),score=268.02 TRINITY_DN7513_c0_g1_i1:117-2474(+)